MKVHHIVAFALTTSAVAASQAYANDQPDALEDVVIISSRIPTPLRQIGTSVSVLTKADIDAHGNLSLVDVMRQMPAIGTSNNGGAGKTTALRIRGEDGFRTLTIFDGIRLSDPSGTQVGSQLEHLMSSGVSRVEVLRGPQRLSYGADAGGVVNIVSRITTGGLFANLNVSGGEFDTQQLSGDIGGGNDQFDFFVSIADTETTGFNSRESDSLLRDDDGYDNTTVHARGGFKLSDDLRFDLVHRNVDSDAGFDGCFSGTTVHDCGSEYELKATRLSVEYTSENFTHSLSYASTETDRANSALGVTSFTANGELERWEYIGSATNLPGFDLVFGADHEDAQNSGVGRNNVGLYAEYLSDFSDNLFLTAGIRYDDNDDFGTNTSHRLSVAYLIDLVSGSTIKFKGSLGSGFRAPSPFEIAYNGGAFAFPPASLVSLAQEESDGYELGVEYIKDDFHLAAVYFNQEIENAIFFDLAGFSGYLQESGTSKSKGVELSGRFDINAAFGLTANYTYNDTQRPNGLQRRRRPEQLANLGLAYSGMRDRMNVNVFFRVSRDAIDEVFGTVVDLDDFEVLDLSASYRVNDNLRIFGRVENLTEENYVEIPDYFTPGRAAYVGLNLSLGR